MSSDSSSRGRPTCGRQDIAIVGMAAVYPDAQDVNALWRILEDGLNTVSKIPNHRFDVSAYTDGGRHPSRTMTTTLGNFIHDVDVFDNAFFHISPREARSMDPQQRLLLQVAYNALEDAGYSPDDASSSFNPDTFGTYIGAATNDYVQNLRNDIDVYYSTGTLQTFLSGKLAYAFKFSGPSIVLDTACSSSTVAVHQACRALQSGDCNAALAGGVNVIASPDMYLGLARGHFLSATGQCRPWDASADGYCRSEGCGLFVLKRLEDAIAENDGILAVIRSIEVNQSGNAHSITHPHVPTQIALFEKVIAAAGVQPHSVDVVECHGTGTQAGDPAELAAVRAVLAKGRPSDRPLHVTSIKVNIGHAEAASGAASLAKLVLMMREKTIPRHVSFRELNPRIPPLEVDNVRIDTVNVPWTCAPQAKRLALLNNFGAAGSNAALILEEYVPPQRRPLEDSRRSAVIVGLSCRSIAATEKRRESYISQLENTVHDDASLQDFAYSATARRQLHRYRIVASGCSKEEVLRSLRIAEIVDVLPADGVVFVFSGQGSQYPGMASELYGTIPLVSLIVDECHQKLVEWGFPGVLDIFHASPGSSIGNDAQEFQVMQAALFVLEYALAALWLSWGVRPIAVVGHSYGEYAALVISGVLNLDDALRLVATRARLICEHCTPGITSMSSVRASMEQLEPLLARFPELCVCCYNNASHHTIGGPIAQLHDFEQLCIVEGLRYTRLDVPYAYHSNAMDPILEGLWNLGRTVTISPPKIPVLSNVAGIIVQDEDLGIFSPDYFARHCREPARFHSGISALQTAVDLTNVAACIEIGPHLTTAPLLRHLQHDGAPLFLPSLLRKQADMGVLCGSLAQLYRTSVPVKWRQVFADLAPHARLVRLPPYPFADTRFWVPFEEERRATDLDDAGHPSATRGDAVLVSRPANHLPAETSDVAAVFETDLGDLAELIQGHKVAGAALCPASVYADLVLSGAMSALKGRGRLNEEDVLALGNVVFAKPLVYASGRKGKVRVEVSLGSSAQQKHVGSFKVSSVSARGGDALVHCSGSLKKTTAEDMMSKVAYEQRLVEREIERIMGRANASETFSTRTVYQMLFPQIVVYSERYWAIKTITLDAASSSAYAVVQLPRSRPERAVRSESVPPVFVDTLFHTAGFLVNFTAGMNGEDAFICSQVDKIKLLPKLLDPEPARYGVYTAVVRSEKGIIAADVYAVELDDPGHRIVACLKRAQFRKVALASLQKALALAADSVPEKMAHLRDASPQPICRGWPEKECIAGTVSTAAGTSTRDLQNDILRVISEISGTPLASISLDAQLTHLGIDSLMTWELVSRLRSIFPDSSLDTYAFAEARSVGDLVGVVKDRVCRETGSQALTTTHSVTTTAVDTDEADSERDSHFRKMVEPCGVDLITVKEIFSTVLYVPVSDIADDADLGSLGLDSLTSIEARHIFQTRLGVHVCEEALLPSRTVLDVLHAIQTKARTLPPCSSSLPPSPPQSGRNASPDVSSPTEMTSLQAGPEIVRLQNAPAGKKCLAPLILIHDGSGLVSGYTKIAPLERDVWAIQNTALGSAAARSQADSGGAVGALARTYVPLLTDTVFRGQDVLHRECYVGGWSFGGIIAFELARHLRSLGIEMRGLVLIDAPAPQTSTPLPDALIDCVVARAATTERTRELVRAQMAWSTRALVEYDARQTAAVLAGKIRAVYLRSREGSSLRDVVVDAHVRAFVEKRNDRWTVAGWEEALGAPLGVFDIPGDHFNAFNEDNVPQVSEQLRKALQHLSD